MRENGNVRAGAGLTLEELRKFLSSASGGDMFYPPDPTEETASAGGTVSTDASGSDSFMYGSTRHWVEALKVVLPSGDLLGLRRGQHLFSGLSCAHPFLGTITLPSLRRQQPPKNAAGYHMNPDMDLIDLFIGSEGTLGLIAEAELKLAPEPAHIIDLAVFPSDGSSFWDLYEKLLHPGPGLRLRALEMMDGGCIRFLREHPGELPATPEGAEFVLLLRAEAGSDDEMENALVVLDGILVECGVDPDDSWGGFEPPERKKMKDFRHALPESVNHRIAELRREFPGIHKFGSDGAVPPERLREYYGTCRGILEERRLPFLVFGHAGQGHIHANAIPENPDGLLRAEEAMRLIAAAAVDMGGTISAEHGLGRLKLPYLPLMYSEEEIEGMESIRRIVDPDRILARAMDFPGTGN
ncbi:MAG: FAD-binding oxidoreductase, partial [Candidatus Fermentibacteraceae bacterium]|nr:FAD-binding oxidoreductase [Candidatus Fermentibacteraceae bacterium]